ncbi:MAG: hypothetical protein IV092_00430 [Burkholderiaceae bacterium]|nr:hypothetical protein [Burkholderiaceae bacterium]
MPTLNHAHPPHTAAWLPLRPWLTELLARERRLAIYGVALLALLLPLALAWGIDERLLRGANVWIKPIKFTLSIAVLALTTAWFVGHLPAAQRQSRAIDRVVWLLIAAGSFELAYITLQAALGQASHYNVADAWHAAMYTLMGIGAMVLTATQPLLAWQLYRHPDTRRPAAYRLAVLLGLVLTFAFGAGVGMLLGDRQPPDGGATLPLLGWVLDGGDLRPAHFVGIHAGQLLPLIGLAAAALAGRFARPAIWAATLAYATLFAALVAWGLGARP